MTNYLRLGFAFTGIILACVLALSVAPIASAAEEEPEYTDYGDVEAACAQQHEPDTQAYANCVAQGGTDVERANNPRETGLALLLGPVLAVSYASFKIASILLANFGVMFNWSLQYLVFDFGKYFGNSEGMLLAWGVLRDFANIALIFGFIFMGIATILDLHNYSARKSLPRLVIFALLLNFSLFITEAVIDTSNVFASILYEQGYSQQCAENMTSEECVIAIGVSGTVLTHASITTVFEGPGQETETNVDGYMNNPMPHILKFLSLALLVSVGAMVMFSATILFFSRAIALALLMVTSPIGFAGMAIPPLQKYAQEWWHRLINQALFAPVFLLLLLIALKIAESLTSLTQRTGGLASAFSANSRAVDMGPLFYFILIIGFLLAALTIAKKLGVVGADFATNAAKTLVTGAAVGLPMGALARGTNLAVGGGAAALRRASEKLPVGAPLARAILKPIEGANLDIRRLPGLGALGAPAKGVATFEEMGKAREDFLDSGKARKRAYDAELAARSNKEKHHADEERANNIAKRLARAAGFATGGDKQFFAGLSAADVAKNKKGLLTPDGAQAITPDTFAQLMDKKSDSLTDVEKERLANERFAGLRAAIADAAANPGDADKQRKLKDTVRGLQKGELEYVPASTFATSEFLGALSDKQRDTLGDSTKRTADERKAVKESSPPIKFGIELNAATNDTDRMRIILDNLQKLTSEQIAKVDDAVLQMPAVAGNLSAQALEKLRRDGGMSKKTIDAISQNNPHAKSGPQAGYW